MAERELSEWGEQLGRSLSPPLVIALYGDLGAGKTTLAKAICRGAGVTGEVLSPTYALVHQYAGDRFPIYHLDLYRLSGPADLANLGWHDILRGDSVVIIEWPERAGDALPKDAVRIELEHLTGDPEQRLVMAE